MFVIIEEKAPPLTHFQWLMTHSMINWAARVEMARYSPLILSEGVPKKEPTSAAMIPAAGKQRRKETP